MGALKLKLLVFDLRIECFQLTPRAAEKIEGIRDIHRGVDQGKSTVGRIRLAELGARGFLAAGGEVCINARRERPELSAAVLLRFENSCLRQGKGRAIREGLADQPVERFGMKHCPPLPGDVLPRNESL